MNLEDKLCDMAVGSNSPKLSNQCICKAHDHELLKCTNKAKSGVLYDVAVGGNSLE